MFEDRWPSFTLLGLLNLYCLSLKKLQIFQRKFFDIFGHRQPKLDFGSN